MKGKNKIIFPKKQNLVFNYLIRYAAQNDEIARLQLENGVLQEKFTNEKRKVSILEVYSQNFLLFICSLTHFFL